MKLFKLIYETTSGTFGTFFGTQLHVARQLVAGFYSVLLNLFVSPGTSRFEASHEACFKLIPSAFFFFTHTKEFRVFKRICKVTFYTFFLYLAQCSSYDVVISSIIR
jgi:hypothetical protein